MASASITSSRPGSSRTSRTTSCGRHPFWPRLFSMAWFGAPIRARSVAGKRQKVPGRLVFFFWGGGFASRNNGLTMFNQYKAWMKTSDSADVSDLGDWSNIQFLSGNLTRSNQHRDLIWVWNNLSGDLTNMFCIFFQWKWWFVEHLGGFHHQKMGETKVDKYIDWTPHQDYIWVCGT